MSGRLMKATYLDIGFKKKWTGVDLLVYEISFNQAK